MNRLPYVFVLTIALLFALALPMSAYAQAPTPTWNTVYSWRSWQNHPTYNVTGSPVTSLNPSSSQLSFITAESAPPGETPPAGYQTLEWRRNNGTFSRKHAHENGTLYTYTGNPIRFLFYGRRNSTMPPVRVEIQQTNGAVRCDLTAAFSGDITFPSSWGWSTASSVNVSTCNLQVGTQYKFFFGNYSADINEILYVSAFVIQELYTPPPPPPPTTTIPNPTGGLCALVIDNTGTVITSTANITSTPSISGTTVITVPANFITNGSFEVPEFPASPFFGPADWQTFGTYTLNSYVYNDPTWAFDGSAYIRSNMLPRGQWEQYIALEDAPAWLFGMYYQWDDGIIITGTGASNNPGIVLNNYQRNEAVVTLPGEPDWIGVERVIEIPPFSIDEQRYHFVTIQLPDTQNPANDPWAVDDLYLVPVNLDEDGNPIGIYCGALAAKHTRNEPPPNPPTSTLPIIGGAGGNIQEFYNLPLPISTAGATCYTCQFPYRQGVEAALAWLGCILRNLFACDLRLWLYAITNAVIGVVYGMNELALYWRGEAAAALFWANNLIATPAALGITAYNQFAAYLNTVPAQSINLVIETTESGWDWFSLLLQVIMLILQLMGQLVAALFDMIGTLLSAWLWLVGNILQLLVRLVVLLAEGIGLILSIVWGIFTALFGVWSVEPLTFGEFVAISNGGVMPDLSPDQANQQAGMMLYFVWGLAAIDAAIWDYYLIWIPFMGAGAIAWTTLIWFIRQWREILPYMG
jgi:hypothetical protein